MQKRILAHFSHGHSGSEATIIFKSILFAFCFVCGLGPCPAGAEPLPEASTGIAVRYPGDAEIGSDPAVIFAEDFKSYDSADALLTSAWNEVRQIPNIRIATEPGNLAGVSRALEFTVPRQSDEVGNSLAKNVSPALNLLFLRYYAKFDTGFDVLGSSHNGSIISASYCCPGARADGYNKFLVSYETWRGETSTANPGNLNIYIYHPDQRGVWGDHFFPTGRVLPFDRTPADFGPEFVPRRDIIPVLGRWNCYELMVKANTPGRRDGRVAMWLDGKLIADFLNLRLRETNALKIDRFMIGLHVRNNTLMVAKKWYANIVAATSYIGPMVPLAH